MSAAAQADTGVSFNSGYTGILQINGYSDMGSVEILNELSAARLILKQILIEDESRVQVHMTDLGSIAWFSLHLKMKKLGKLIRMMLGSL